MSDKQELVDFRDKDSFYLVFDFMGFSILAFYSVTKRLHHAADHEGIFILDYHTSNDQNDYFAGS